MNQHIDIIDRKDKMKGTEPQLKYLDSEVVESLLREHKVPKYYWKEFKTEIAQFGGLSSEV